ncbi:hypothetical protein Lser_V15G29616 [Lactuca serriola]
MANLKFADMYNLVIVLDDPPVAHSEFNSMIYRLRECCLSCAITVNPIICQNIVREFWQTTKMSEVKGEMSIEAVVKGCRIKITEQYIRDTLLINDESNFPTEIGTDDIQRVLGQMGYEGIFPRTVKKILPPYWRFLAHVFVSYISGRISGTDEISLRNSGAIISLAAGMKFNLSKYSFDELLLNVYAMIRGTRDAFLLYLRFVQVSVDNQFPEMVKDGDNMDIKSLGPHTFGLIKQNRKGKVVFQGLHPLVKFGNFAEIDESSESHGTSEKALSDPTSSENVMFDDVITISDHDADETATVNAQGSRAETDLYEDLNLTGFDNDDIPLNFDCNEDFMTGESLDKLLDNVNEVAHPTTETREKGDVLEATPTTINPSTEIATPMVTVSRFLPLMLSYLHLSRRRIILRMATQSVTAPPTTTLAIVTTEPVNEGPSTFFKAGGPSFPTGFSPPRIEDDVATVRLARLLAEEQFSTPLPRGKGISIGDRCAESEEH